MLYLPLRPVAVAVLSIGVALASGCGSGGEAGLDATAQAEATAVSSNPAAQGKGVYKVDPVVRPGVEAPRDSAVDEPPTGNPGATLPTGAQRLFATGFEDGVALTKPAGFRGGDRYLIGSDTAGYAFPAEFWSAPNHWRSWVLSTVGEMTNAPVTNYLSADIKQVMGRDGIPTRALSLHSKSQSGGGGSQAIYVQDVGMATEAVVFQRMWVKFDPGMLSRAHFAGSARFEQTFWEAIARPDYRIRLNVRFDDVIGGLYWHASADRLDGGPKAWEAALNSTPVVLASPTQPTGWHAVEIWMDRPNGRFAVAIDGKMLVDYRGDLFGASGNRIDVLRMMMVHNAAAPLAEVLFEDLELWEGPPAGATLTP